VEVWDEDIRVWCEINEKRVVHVLTSEVVAFITYYLVVAHSTIINAKPFQISHFITCQNHEGFQ